MRHYFFLADFLKIKNHTKTAVKVLAAFLFAIAVSSITGCVSIPSEPLSSEIKASELSSHVYFLTQPALKGRKAKSWESNSVLEYLTNKFQACGMVPWQNQKEYALPFGFGKNFVAVLPGTDKKLADEFVVIGAHYDHIGKTKDGICPGACDNASGVAALIEIAEYLSAPENRPKRSVCFAAFDSEEKFLLGSFAFTARDDFDPNKIVAMINIDLLGREFLDVVPNSLVVVGTESYPRLRSEILAQGPGLNLNVMPIGTRTIGPRGDHVAFEGYGMPVLFFSCGMFKDYHKPTDTPEKIDFRDLRSSTTLIANTLQGLANAEHIEKPTKPMAGDKEQLKSLGTILKYVNSNIEKFKLDPNNVRDLLELQTETDQMIASDDYSLYNERCFHKKTLKALIPAMATADDSLKDNPASAFLIDCYVDHPEFFVGVFRDIVLDITRHKPGLFDVIKFNRKSHLLLDDELSFTKYGENEYELALIRKELSLSFKLGALVKNGDLQFSVTSWMDHFIGTKNEVEDFCLLKWREKFENESYCRIWQKVLKKVTGQTENLTYAQCLQRHLDNTSLENEKQWLAKIIYNDKLPLKTTQEWSSSKFIKLLKDRNISASIRAGAIWGIADNAEKDVLLTLADIVDDEVPLKMNVNARILEPSFPFADHEFIKAIKKDVEKDIKETAGKTIGTLAQSRLKTLTSMDFGTDSDTWRQWINDNIE